MGETLCPRSDLHSPAPVAYLAWHQWAEQMSRTHKQARCPGCGLFKVWVPIPDAPALPPIEYRLDHGACGCCDGDDTNCGCLYHPGAHREVARRRWEARKAAKAAVGEAA